MPLMIVVLGLGIVMLVCVVVLVALLLCNNSAEEEDCRLLYCICYAFLLSFQRGYWYSGYFYSFESRALTHISFVLLLSQQ